MRMDNLAGETPSPAGTSDSGWQLAMDSAGQGYWDVDEVSGRRFCSAVWFSLRGLSPDDTASTEHESWMARVHPDDVERLKSGILDVDSGKTDVINHEYRERHADGHYIWILCKGRVFRRKTDGRPARYVGTDTDITAIKDVTADLRILAHRHQLAMGTSNLGVWEFHVATQEAIWDDNTKRLFQVTDEEMKERSFWEKVIHPEDIQSLEASSAEAVRTKSSFSADYRILPKDGIVRHVRTRAAFYEDKIGGSKLVGVIYDVTAEKTHAAELQRAKELAEKQYLELKQARAQIEWDALHDALTGLPNRRHLELKLNALEKGSVAPSNWRTAILHVDLDRFKQINDTLGHLAGDAVLKNAAQMLQSNMPTEALVCRAGGDEFVVVLEGKYCDQMLSGFATSATKAISAPFYFNNHECLLGASIGIAAVDSGTESGKQLLLNSDIALYRAKSEGRNRFCFYTEDMQAKTLSDKCYADDIMRGLDRGEFHPFYQPQIDAHTREITGVEALARWFHPQKGVLGPADFLDIAEDINVLAQIDDMIMRKALAEFAQWQSQGLQIPNLSVNVSARRIGDPQLLKQLSNIRIPKGQLSFELLESIYLEDENELISANLAGLRALGIAIELDDFGTGHASIASLVNLRPQRFKIDRSLIKPITASVEQRRLVRSIIDIGKALNIAVVAEGVETPEHARALETLDCDILQGHLFSKPLPAHELEIFVRNKSWLKAA